jgi:hypothetical protein
LGQQITVAEPTIVGDVAVFVTDRSVTGQDGSSYTRDDLEDAEGVPAELARRLTEGDEAVTGVFVASNQVVANRDGGWDEKAVSMARETIEAFFVFYP